MTGSLVTGEVTLAVAERLCAAAIGEAERLGVLVSAAVVDAGGNLVAFSRMDGAEIAGVVLAPDKAYTAVANRAATHELASLCVPGGALFGLHSAAGGRFIVFGGGVPLWGAGRVVGGVGVSGAEVDQDVSCALAAARLWQETGAGG